MKTYSMYLIMEGIKIYAFHGVNPQENIVGSYFYVDLKIKTDFSKAALCDDLCQTISYADVFARVKEEMAINSKLLENVCHRICKRLFNDFSKIESINITLSKENPPMNSESKKIGVEMQFLR